MNLLVVLAVTLPLGLGINVNLQCPELTYTSVDCNECNLSNETSKGPVFTERLHQDMKKGKIKFFALGDLIIWVFPPIFEASHTYVTLYYEKDSKFAATIPGCCGVPMMKGHCILSGVDIRSQVVGKSYVSFTLFRTRLVESLNLNIDRGLETTTTKKAETTQREETEKTQQFEPGRSGTIYETGELPNMVPITGLPPTDKENLPPTNPEYQIPYSDPSYSDYDLPYVYSNYFGKDSNIGIPDTTPEVSTESVVFTTARVVDSTAQVPVARDMRPWEKYLREEDAKRYEHVCVFEIPKVQVMARKNDTAPYSVDHYLFQREVYDMPGYFYKEDHVFHHAQPNVSVNCSSRSYSESPQSIYNLYSLESDKSTYTCLVLWLTISLDNELGVKCMPHNATYGANTPAPETLHRPTEEKATTILIISISVVGGLVFLILSTVVTLKWTQALNALISESKRIPETLEGVLDNDNHNLKPTLELEEEDAIPLWLGAAKLEKENENRKPNTYKTVESKVEKVDEIDEGAAENNKNKNFYCIQTPHSNTTLFNPTYKASDTNKTSHTSNESMLPTFPVRTDYTLEKGSDGVSLKDDCELSESPPCSYCIGSNVTCSTTITGSAGTATANDFGTGESPVTPYRDHKTFLPITLEQE